MNRCFLFLFLLVFALSGFVHADANDQGYIGLWSNVHTYHLSRENEVNEKNQLLGLQWNRLFFSTFNNSFDQRSYALGWRWLEYKNNLGAMERVHWNVGLSPGLAYGYGNRFLLSFWNLTPGLIPSAGIEFELKENIRLGSEVFYIWSERGGVLMTGLTAGWQW